MEIEKRKNRRFEPPFVDAFIKYEESEIRGQVLDSSRGGMAVALSERLNTPKEGDHIKIFVANADCKDSKITVGDAVVLRQWESGDILDNGKGFAVKFNSGYPLSTSERYLLNGIQQKKRLETQAKMVPQDITYLGNYRRDLISCQMKLFIVTLTVGVAMAGAYFGLTYHTIASEQLQNPDLRFWRTMIAALPGCLAIACALMVAQKSISIQRIDSYLLLLKEYCIIDQYPREYRGWESALRKMREILRTKKCLNCETKRKCGELKQSDIKRIKERGLFYGPVVGLYHVIVYTTFFTVLGLSLIALVFEIKASKWETVSYMWASSAITILIIAVMVILGFIFYHLRRGKYSVEDFRRSWIDLLNRCRW